MKKLGKYTPIWNYYCCISNLDFDIKYIFLTNNIAENINALLNSFFNKKYPLFEQWKNAILSLVEIFEKKPLEITRRNYSSNLMLYYVKKIKIDKKNIRLLKAEEIGDLINLEKNKQNILSFKTISEILNLSDDIINEINFNKNIIDSESDSEINDDDKNDKYNIKGLLKNLNNLNIEGINDFQYFLIQILKDVDLEKIFEDIKRDITE